MVDFEDRDRLTNVLENLIMNDILYEITFKLNLSDGEIRYVNSKASLYKKRSELHCVKKNGHIKRN